MQARRWSALNWGAGTFLFGAKQAQISRFIPD